MQVIRFKKLALTLLLLLKFFVIFLCAIYLKYDLSEISSSSTSTELVPTELVPTELAPTELVQIELVPAELLPSKLLQTQESFKESHSKLNDEFLVNTLGCKMTRLPVMSSKIQEYFVPPDPIFCLPPAITESDECKK